MARSSYRQEAGNPLQHELLPAYKLPFEFPYQGDTRGSFVVIRKRMLFTLLLLDVVHTVFAIPLSRIVTPEMTLIVGLLCALSGWGGIAQAMTTFFKVLGIALLMSLLMWVSNKQPILCYSLLAGLLSYYLFQFGKHWIYRCTASPMPRDVAHATRLEALAQLRIWASLPGWAALATILSGNAAWFPGSLMILSLINGLLLVPERSVLHWGIVAFTSWCGYNAENQQTLGVLKSPAGPVHVRQTLLLMLAGSFTFLFGYAGVESAAFLSGLVGFVFLPTVAFALSPIGLLAPLLVRMGQIRKAQQQDSGWNAIVNDTRHSSNPVLRDSYFLGYVASDGSPLFVHRDTMNEHVHFLGSSGGGKTSKGLCPWIEQTIRFGDSSVIVLDLKADTLELLASLEAGAQIVKQEQGRELPLKVFSSTPDHPTHAFNPMNYPFWHELEINQKTDMICSALGLNYGTDFGASYYSSTNAAIVYEAFRQDPMIASFEALSARCQYLIRPQSKSLLHPEVKKAGVHVCEELKRMAAIPQLQITPRGTTDHSIFEQSIDLCSMFQSPQLLYLHLPSTIGAGSTPAIARFFTYFLLASASQTKRTCPVYLVIDEFQRMAAKSLDFLLQLARSMGIGVVLSNQSMEDLKTPKSNLIPAIEANCQYRQWFDVGSVEDVERIERVAGQTVETFSSQSQSVNSKDISVTNGWSETLVPRLSTNEINLAGSTHDLSVVRIGRDSGYAQFGRFPFVVRTGFHISKAEYDQRRSFCWPRPTEGMMIANHAVTSTPAKPTGPSIVTEVDGEERGSSPGQTHTDQPNAGLPDSLASLFGGFPTSPPEAEPTAPNDDPESDGGDDE